MEPGTHDALVSNQYGSRAAAYLTSAVHAEGADLRALAALLHNRPDARVLDLGCGGGHVSFAVAPHVRQVIACDLTPEMLQVVARAATERGLDNIETRQGTAEKLAFDACSFDAVVSRYSAHHWRDLDAGLREIVRVVKPGGIVGIVDSTTPGVPLFDTFLQSIELLRDASHVRNYTRAEWEAAIVRAGLLPGPVQPYRVRLDFATWIARMRTPKLQADAIRALQGTMSEDVVRYFGIGADGSFDLDVALFVASRPTG